MRLVVAQVVRTCRDAVTQLMEASGASAHLRSNPLQRIHRDVNTLSCHTVFDLEMGAENYGRLLLGMEPATPV
jgi:alkylation response protein AidB-like acyl-CoA dehydrogenase